MHSTAGTVLLECWELASVRSLQCSTAVYQPPPDISDIRYQICQNPTLRFTSRHQISKSVLTSVHRCLQTTWRAALLATTHAQVIRGYVGDRSAKPVFNSATPFDILGQNYQRPFELATLRLFNMIGILPKCESSY